MSVGAPTNRTTDRASAEIVFVALLTVSVIAIGAVGISMGNTVTADTTERMETPEFDISERDNLNISYTAGPLMSSDEETDSIILYDGENEHVLYDSSSSSDLQPGDDLITRGKMKSLGIEEGSTVEIVWVRKNGDSEVVEELFIPDDDVTGSGDATPNGTVNVSMDGVTGNVEWDA